MPVRALARVNLAAIERNCVRLCEELSGGAALGVVVKADGYGHGAVAAARAALAGGARWICVAAAVEARTLREAGIDGPLLVMGALSPEEVDVALDAAADVTAWRLGFVEQVAARVGADRTVGVHVKLDTGMGRLGTRDPAEADAVAEAVATAPGLELAGAMTHFATADMPDDDGFFAAQLARFEPWARALQARHPQIVVHAANSAATLRAPASHFDLVRCGIAAYGMDPFHDDPTARRLEPALELHSYVADLKHCAPGESAGYGRRFVAARATELAVLPIGYGDGVRRGLTNNADVLIAGARRPLVGTVSMDNLTVDLGPEPAVGPGAEAVLIGADGPERITAEEVARRLGTINYEITCGITARVPRIHHRDGAQP
ncbi:MAG TPA: alanine racemase [Solirubrobacteraceae bacterium]|nr:alanine racemase [Solirubrobacteraceae bacterium]